MKKVIFQEISPKNILAIMDARCLHPFKISIKVMCHIIELSKQQSIIKYSRFLHDRILFFFQLKDQQPHIYQLSIQDFTLVFVPFCNTQHFYSHVIDWRKEGF